MQTKTIASRLYASAFLSLLVLGAAGTLSLVAVIIHDGQVAGRARETMRQIAGQKDDGKIFVYLSNREQHSVGVAEIRNALAKGKWWNYTPLQAPSVNIVKPSGGESSIPFEPVVIRRALQEGYRLQTAVEAHLSKIKTEMQTSLWSDSDSVDSGFLPQMIGIVLCFLPFLILFVVKTWLQWIVKGKAGETPEPR